MKSPLLVINLIAAGCLFTNPAKAIVHGSPVDATPTLGVLALESLNSTGERVDICTGIMIGPNVFLTAAHCLNGGGFGISKVDDKELTQQILIPQAKIQVSATLDLALGLVEGVQKMDFAKIVPRASPPDTTLEVRGYGLDQYDSDSVLLPPEAGHETERAGMMTVFAMDWNLMTFRSRSTEDSYAVASDAGAPIFNTNHELEGIFVDFKMIDDQDQWGNCYLQNQAIRVNSPAAQFFISQAQANLGQ